MILLSPFPRIVFDQSGPPVRCLPGVFDLKHYSIPSLSHPFSCGLQCCNSPPFWASFFATTALELTLDPLFSTTATARDSTHKMLIFLASESVPSLKLCREARTTTFQRTQKQFVEIPLGSRLIKIINYFNGDPKSKLREMK